MKNAVFFKDLDYPLKRFKSVKMGTKNSSETSTKIEDVNPPLCGESVPPDHVPAASCPRLVPLGR